MAGDTLATPRYVAGVDENGLGPRLGPLTVTGVVVRTASEAGYRRATRAPKGKLGVRIGDSKELVSYGQNALGEAWARVLARRAGLAAETPAQLFRSLSIESEEELRRPCPNHVADQCWPLAEPGFASDDTLIALVERDVDTLAAGGVDLLRPFVAITCTKRLNEAAALGVSRFTIDLHSMERLVCRMHKFVGAPVLATCGKVGGIDKYAGYFGPLAGRLHVTLEEGRRISAYRFPELGEISFLRDADASHLVVCIASLVGKWVRDALTSRIVRHYQGLVPDLPDASGYHDPVTTRFIRATELVRSARNVPDDCFVRNRAAVNRAQVL
jgi:ribonuclease HII